MNKFINQKLLVLKGNKSAVLTAIAMMLIGDVVFVKDQSDVIIFTILGVYILAIFFYTLSSKSTFLFCFLFIFLLFFELIFTGFSDQAEKASVWLFFFMAVGILQRLFLNKNEKS